MKKKAVHSKSFAMNIFRGIIETEQTFPYPNPLDEEQRENLQMLIPIAECYRSLSLRPLSTH